MAETLSGDYQVMAESGQDEHSSQPRSYRGARPRSARAWPNHARSLAENLQDNMTTFAERAMTITENASEIDDLVIRAMRSVENGDPSHAQELLRTVIAKTTVQRRAASDVLTDAANAAKRLAWALVGKYD